MQPMKRIQENIVASQERRFLNWACSWMPYSITSDHLTALSVVGAFMALSGYIASRYDSRFLLIAALGFVVNWFGDSLDGSLARYRKVTRPRYGYFLDHSVDAFCTLLMVGGMGLSPYVRMDVAMFAVVGYLALCIHVFLKNQVTGTFQLTFVLLGPTELRMVFVALTLFMLLGGQTHWAGSTVLSDCDIVLLITGGVFMALFVNSTATMMAQLRAIEGNGRQPASLAEAARTMTARQIVSEPVA
jgi:phosphatidylglycerophosphate synthase